MIAWSGIKHAIGFDRQTLERLADRVREDFLRYYRPFDTWNGRKWRHIDQPFGELRRVQDAIKRWLVKCFPPHPCLHGGVRRRSPRTAAELHVGSPVVVTIDVSQYFPSVTCRAVYAFFKRVGCIPDVAHVLTLLTTVGGHLPQGAPTSTILANLVNSPMFERIRRSVESQGCSVSGYVDDIQISGPRAHACIRGVMGILRSFGYYASREKTRVMRSPHERVVLGVSVGNGIALPQEKRRSIAESIDEIAAAGVAAEAEITSLKHRIRWARTLDPGFAEDAMRALAAVEQAVEVAPAVPKRNRRGITSSCDVTSCRAPRHARDLAHA